MSFFPINFSRLRVGVLHVSNNEWLRACKKLFDVQINVFSFILINCIMTGNWYGS